MPRVKYPYRPTELIISEILPVYPTVTMRILFSLVCVALYLGFVVAVAMPDTVTIGNFTSASFDITS